MVDTEMIDQNAIGIRNVYEIQRGRMLPLPTYDLSERNRVSVTIYGRVLDEAYTRLLAAEPEMDLETVFMLDLVQKRSPITRGTSEGSSQQGPCRGAAIRSLRSRRKSRDYPVPMRSYVRRKGLDASICKELIIKLLRTRPCTRAEVVSAISHALPEDMNDAQRKEACELFASGTTQGAPHQA